MSISLSQESINVDEMLYREDGIYYLKENDQLFSGSAFLLDENGKYEYIIKDGLRQGTSKSYRKNGKLKEVRTFKDNKKTGPYIYYYENGDREEGTYEDGVEEGPYVYYYENGNRKESTYINGKQQGLFIFDYADGRRLEVTFKDDKLEGSYKKYYKSGNLEEESFYKNNKLDGIQTLYFDNEQLIKNQVINYSNGSIDGLYERYYENGQLKKKASVNSNEKYFGNYKEYYENGQLKIDSNYKAGKLEGSYKEYYENGKLRKDGAYAYGEFVPGLRLGTSNLSSELERANSGNSNSGSSQKGLYDLRDGEVVFRIAVTESDVDGIFNYDGFSSVYGVEGNVNGTIKNNTLYEDGVMRIGSIDSGGRWIKYEQWTIPKIK